MTEEQQIILQLLPMVIVSDIRLQVHTLAEVDGTFVHKLDTCPRCKAYYLLKNFVSYPQENIDL